MTDRAHEPGCHTRSEILSQPSCWRSCFAALSDSGELNKVRTMAPSGAEWLFLGCGSSYYLAQSAAASWALETGERASALPASELLLYPEISLRFPGRVRPVVISRSGRTSEVVRAAEYLESVRNVRTLAVTCAQGQPLERVASSILHLLPADEQSTVMTRSFSSMLLALQFLAASVGASDELAADLQRLPDLVERQMASLRERIGDFVHSRCFSSYVFLAQGPYFGLAQEGHLKVKEMSCSDSHAYHSLEFRHGPKAVVGNETLLTFFLSDHARKSEVGVLEEMKRLGGVTFVLVNRADARIRELADLLIEFGLDVAEVTRLAAFIIPCQLLAYETSLQKGYDPDAPRNLSRVVLLENEG